MKYILFTKEHSLFLFLKLSYIKTKISKVKIWVNMQELTPKETLVRVMIQW